MVQSTVSILEEFFILQVRKMRFIVFQKDEAPPHFAVDVRRFLDETLAERCAPRSLDLTQLDFFLWKHLKNVSSCEDLAELKSRIHDEIKSISI